MTKIVELRELGVAALEQREQSWPRSCSGCDFGTPWGSRMRQLSCRRAGATWHE